VAAQSSALNKGGSKQARRFYGGLFCRDSVLRSGATKPVIEITDENAGRPAESGRGPKAQDKRWEKAKKRGARWKVWECQHSSVSAFHCNAGTYDDRRGLLSKVVRNYSFGSRISATAIPTGTKCSFPGKGDPAIGLNLPVAGSILYSNVL